MDFFGSYVNTGSMTTPSGQDGYNMYIFAVIGIVLALLIWGVASFFWNRSKTMPTVQGFADAEQVDLSGADVPKEGFVGGVVVGAGEPDCLRTSSEAAQVYAIFANRRSSTEEGPADFEEFRLLLSKLSCFKKDLIGTWSRRSHSLPSVCNLYGY